jgi:hypothetical protein
MAEAEPARLATDDDIVMGESICAGAWFENRNAFDVKSAPTFRTEAGSGAVMGTRLVGLMLFGGTAGFDGDGVGPSPSV